MSYCRNCGAVLPDGARFCASCGTPADSGQIPVLQGNAGQGYANEQGYGNAGQAYAGAQGCGNGAQAYAGAQGCGNGAQAYAGAQGCGNGAQPYAGAQGCGNGAQAYVNAQTQGNVVPPYAGGMPYSNMPPYGNGAQPYADGQAYGNGAQPYADGQAYGNGAQPYADGQAYGNAAQPYADGKAYGNGAQPYADGQVYGNAGTPYQDMPDYVSMGGAFNGNPYSPYGAVTQPQSSRKTLAVIGAIVGLIVAIALVLLIVLLTRDNRHRTYEQAVSVFMDGLKEQDIDRLSEAFPERIREDLRRDVLRNYDSEDEFWEDYNESLEWFCGKRVKLTYEIAWAQPLLDYQISDCEQEFLEKYHYDVTVSGGYEVEIEMTFKGSEDEYDMTLDLEVIEIGGKWYVITNIRDVITGWFML